MLRKVDKYSGIPAYLQIVNMIKSEILLGNLQNGSQFPSIRDLQVIFDVNINTVIKALEKLKNEGYIESEQGIGYFIKKDITFVTEHRKVFNNLTLDVKILKGSKNLYISNISFFNKCKTHNTR